MSRFFRYNNIIITAKSPPHALRLFIKLFNIDDEETIMEEVIKKYEITHVINDNSIDYIKNDEMCFPYKIIVKKQHTCIISKIKLQSNNGSHEEKNSYINYNHVFLIF
jgi:tRNA A22 N-methylase